VWLQSTACLLRVCNHMWLQRQVHRIMMLSRLITSHYSRNKDARRSGAILLRRFAGYVACSPNCLWYRGKHFLKCMHSMRISMRRSSEWKEWACMCKSHRIKNDGTFKQNHGPYEHHVNMFILTTIQQLVSARDWCQA
jgi:hypothetical protein